ncbi:biotin--[acetyl-CoA-carboxylase] ligase [candidate division WOR-3 bacterium]|nr:biotin--[acetyl-CoA-carboxylase] ligase [candidate division WOR-3 bacterium]
MYELTSKLFKKVYEYEKLSSTNETARELLRRDGVPDYFLVLANEQTQGKGRWGRGWWSPKGGFWCSLVVPKIPLPSLRAAFSVVQTIKELTPLRAGIRWPNDILVRNKKIGGILTENEKGKLVIGVGVNVNQESFSEELSNGTSLRIEFKHILPIEDFLDEFIQNFETNLKDNKILDKIRGELLLLGERVTVRVKDGLKVGEFWDIEADGGLLFREPSGIISKLTPSEVKFIR